MAQPAFGLIGFPISHSQSPALFEAAYGGLWTYELIETDDFSEAWEVFISRFQAVNVTMPFKEHAARKADIKSPEVELTGMANVLVKTAGGVKAFNTDFLAVKAILKRMIATRPDILCGKPSVAVIGYGGAGRAAEAAAHACGLETRIHHHDGIKEGVEADIVIYTLPGKVEGTGRIKAKVILEANYRNPSFSREALAEAGLADTVYIPGTEWLKLQAEYGFPLMTGMDIPKKFHNLQNGSLKGEE